MAKRNNKFKRGLLVFSVAISILFFSIIGFVTIVYNKYDLDIANLTSLNNGIKVYSATGNDTTLYNSNRSIVDINELPKYVLDAFVSVEDKNFYSHNGYDIKRIIKSCIVNITSQSKSQGASTISQQLIKNALLSNEKTYSRKIKEIVLSIKMEKNFSKDEILEMYLNTIYFGSNAYGIENASKTYFNKSAKDLTINEACCLAGLIKSPAYYSPKTHYDNAIGRKNLVAKKMFENKKISNKLLNEIQNSEIILTGKSQTDNSYEKEAIFEACSLLNITERDLINNKYQIITFKDDKLQEEVTNINNQIIINAENATNSSLDSLSIVASNDGKISAYCSNSNYNLHNLIRQPASTLKPFAVYLPCFKHNILSPASLILDEPINYSGFKPNNADKQFHGYVSTRYALAHSLNIPAVKALEYVGVKKAKSLLTDFGININNSDLNLSLSLGATKNGVKILDLMNAYSTLANQGNYYKLCFVDKILDESGKIIYQHEDFASKVCDAESCFLTNDILKDCAKVGTAKKLNVLDIPIASKTGTASNEYGNTDLYNISYTSEHTLLTWIADIDAKNLPSSLLSSAQPTEINKQISSILYQSHAPSDFSKPEGVQLCPFDLNEYEVNHVILQPTNNIERFVDYDYFKTDNLPKIRTEKTFDFDVKINKFGATITFESNKSCEYKIYKQTKQEKILLDIIKETNGEITIQDKNIFNSDNVDYYITDKNDKLISEIKKIKPQEYLMNLLNIEIISSKKKWLV